MRGFIGGESPVNAVIIGRVFCPHLVFIRARVYCVWVHTCVFIKCTGGGKRLFPDRRATRALLLSAAGLFVPGIITRISRTKI